MYRLLWNFDKESKNFSKDYAFDIDEQKCDVMLTLKNVWDINEIHFYILFDVINKERRLVLRNFSINIITISYDDQTEKEVRYHFIWILNLKKHTKKREKAEKWRIKVHVRELSFKVIFVSHRTCETEYKKKITKFQSQLDCRFSYRRFERSLTRFSNTIFSRVSKIQSSIIRIFELSFKTTHLLFRNHEFYVCWLFKISWWANWDIASSLAVEEHWTDTSLLQR